MVIDGGRAILSAEVHTGTGAVVAKIDVRPSITKKQYDALREHFLSEVWVAFEDLWREIQTFQDRDPY